MKILRNKVNQQFSEAMEEVVDTFEYMREKMKELISDGEFSYSDMIEVMGKPIDILKAQSQHQTQISLLFDEAEQRYKESPKKFMG